MSLCTSIPATYSCTTLTLRPPPAAAPDGWGYGTPPARAPDQYRRLTHAHAAATGVTRQGAPEPVSFTASNGPRAYGHDRRQPQRACTFRLRTASQTPQTTPAGYGPHAPTAGRDPIPSPHGRATQWLMISHMGSLNRRGLPGQRGLAHPPSRARRRRHAPGSAP